MGAPMRPDGRPQPPRPRNAHDDAEIQTPLDALQGVAFADGDANVAAVSEVGPGIHRASPLGIVIQLFKLLLALAVAGVGLVVSLMTEGPDPDEPWAAAVACAVLVAALLLAIASAVLSWYTHTWELADDALVLRSGLLVRNARRIPYQRVHSVDLSASVFERVLGLTTLTIDTGAGEAAAGNSVKSMKRMQAEALKRALFARKTLLSKEEALRAETSEGVVPSIVPEVVQTPPEADPTADISYEMQLSNKLHLLASLTDLNMGAAFISVIGAVAAVFQFAEPLIGTLLYNTIEQAVVGALDGVALQISAADMLSMLPLALVVVLVFGVVMVVLTWVISAVLAFVRWGGFVLRRRGSRVEVSSGLLSRTTRAVDLSRVQSVSVDQCLPRRLLGYAQVSVNVVASVEGSQQRASVTLHPCLPLGEVPEFLAQTLPEFAEAAAPRTPDEDLERLPKAALRRTLLRGLYWTVALVLCMAVGSWAVVSSAADDPVVQAVTSAGMAFGWALLIIGCICMFVVRALAWRIRRIGTRDAVLVLVDGGVSRRVSYTARTKLQSLSRRVTPFQAHAGVATVAGRTACVSAEKDPRMRDVAAACANDLMAWVRPRYDNLQQAEEALREAGVVVSAL